MSQIYSRCDSMIMWLNDGLGLCAAAGREFSRRRDIHSMATLLRYPYFSRVWIIQEILHAPRVRVLTAGNTWCEWRAMQEQVGCSPVDANDLFPDTRPLLAPTSDRSESIKTLAHYISEFSSNLCDDPRDRVYAFMGLVEAQDRITIDYSKTPLEVFVDVLCCLRFFLFPAILPMRLRISRDDMHSLACFLKLVADWSGAKPSYAEPDQRQTDRYGTMQPPEARRHNTWVSEIWAASARTSGESPHWNLVQLLKQHQEGSENHEYTMFRRAVLQIQPN